MAISKKTDAKMSKDARYIKKLFGGAVKTFDTAKRGFVPLPIIYRKLFRVLTPPQLRVLVYLCTRASKSGLCYPTYEEMAHELGLTGRKNLTPHIKVLEQLHFIETRSSEGKKFYLILDPAEPISYLFVSGKLSDDDLDEINDLRELLKQPMFSAAELRAGQKSTSKTKKQP